jgi:site-specific recombinase XerD
MIQKEICARTGLNPETVLRLDQVGLVPAWANLGRPQRGRWRIFDSGAPLLFGIAAAFVRAGGSAVDAAMLLATLRGIPAEERAEILRAAVIVRWPGTCRLDWFACEAAVPRGAEVRNGKTLDQVLARYCGRSAPEDLVEARLAEYVDHFEAKVKGGQRSANTLREIHRYSQPDGHFSFWFDRSVNGIGYGDLEDWHLWLGERGISPKTQKNISNTFKTVLRWLHRRGAIERVPEFPAIKTEEHAPRILTIDQQRVVLESIPWERRGAFLAAATEALRMSEIRALNIDDYADGKLYVGKAVQGPRVAAPIRSTRTRSAEWRELCSQDLIQWIAWRLEQATPESRLRGELALFWNPTARNKAKRWTPDCLERLWNRACKEAIGFSVGFQEGTRHTFLTALAQGGMSERMLRAFSRHRDGRSLDHYAKPKITREAIVKALPRDK